MKIVNKLAPWVLLVMMVLPIAVFAYDPPYVPPPSRTGPITGGQGVITLVEQILQWLATLFWILAAVFVFYAGFLYLTAGGDAEKVKKANHQLLYAIIAIIVGLMAYGLPKLVETVLGRQ
ncbi:MAG: hypothetical protein AAB686_03815 [Patescibacteria group bacterium]